MKDIRAAVVTVSDGVSRGTRRDESGEAAEAILREMGLDVDARSVVPDERDRIEEALRDAAASGFRLVVTTGGTGLGPRDVTPEATKAVIEREAPGLAELMRSSGLEHTAHAALSRAVAGALGETLILNLPGSPTGVRESLAALRAVLPHALELLGGTTGEHSTGHGGGARRRERRESSSGEPDRPDGSWEVVATAVRVHGDPPCRAGQKIRIGEHGPLSGTLGCAEFDSAAAADAPAVARAGQPATRTYTHELGTVEVFLEPQARPPRLIVVSATPVALELLRLARMVGYRTVLVEPRAERVSADHRSAADRVAVSLDDVEVTDDDDAVHTDHDAPGVAESVAALLRSPARFVGVMGSRRHIGPHVEALREMGFSEEDLERIRTPVGLDIGARTPAEIALSIAAGLVGARAGRSGSWLDRGT